MAMAMAPCVSELSISRVSATLTPSMSLSTSSSSSSSRLGSLSLTYSPLSSSSTRSAHRVSMETADKPKAGAKPIPKDTLLTPRFYTTDFDEMEQMFNTEMNANLKQEEFDALLQEFKTDYNQTHFVRNAEFKKAAEDIQGPMRKIFVEFLERSCTAEFSGFLLYKELGRRLKVSFRISMI